MTNKKRVLVAMSGGIDSSVAAIMLHEQGYEVVGITMKTWEYTRTCSTKKQIGCCNLDTIEDAREVAVKQGFPYIVLDIRKEFSNYVINNFKKEYLAGRTPNPCILCNTHIKWEALLRRADKLKCHYIATGHYAQVRKENGRYILHKGIDKNKDQSYALWGLSQESLSRTKFPLGKLTKPTIRKFAKERGYTSLTKKSESYEICFIPDNDYRSFLKRNIKGLEEQVKGGEFVLENGKVVGHHQGYPFYTIGQRKGLNIALGHPVYVTQIDPKTNRITLGTFNELERDGMYVHKINMIKYKKLDTYIDTITKVRYNDAGTPAVIYQQGNQIKAFFGENVTAITPGQAAVFYEGNDVVAGGWIKASFRQKNKNNLTTPN